MYKFIFLLIITCSCARETPIEPTPHHTLLVYMAGDNNLSSETYQKVDSIISGWNNTKDNLLIYQDAETPQKNPTLSRVVADKKRPYTEVIVEYPEQNSASSTVFAQVIQDALKSYPAESYGLLLFSHATGWLPDDTFLHPRSVTEDSGDVMDLKDFAAAIPSHQFRYIVFEACLMAGVEVACELKEKTDYIVASSTEILSPGFTEIYPKLINYLFEPEPNLIGLARAYYEHVNAKKSVYRSATISVIQTSEINKLIEATAPLLRNNPNVDPENIQEFNRNKHKLYFDLGDYLCQISTDEQYTAIKKQLEKTVIYQAATPQFMYNPIKKHCGLTIYIPQPAYPVLNAKYKNYNWYKLIHQ